MGSPPCSITAAQQWDGGAEVSGRDGSLRIGNYVVRPDANCWIVATLKTHRTGAQQGEEYETDLVHPGRFDQALRTLLDRLVRDGIEPDTSLEQAVTTVAYHYATIGSQRSA